MFYVTNEFNRFSHRRWASFSTPVRFSKFFTTWIHRFRTWQCARSPRWQFYRRYQVRTIELMVIHYLHSKLLIWAHLTGQPRQQILKRRHLVTRRNMECFQGLAILIVVCTVIICALLTRYFFLLKRTKNVPSSTTNCEDLNGHNRVPGNPVKINIEWPHLNGRKQPIEHSEQPFNQVGFMIIT